MARVRSISTSSAGHVHGRMQRVSVVFLLVIGAVLVLLSRMQHPLMQSAQLKALAVITPVMEAVSAPVEALHHALSDWNALLDAHEMNAVLRAENDRLRHWQSVAVSLSRENDSLRALARYKPVAQTAYLSAKIVGHSQSAFSRGLLMNVGAADGVKPYQPVIDAYGMVGRVVQVSDHASRLMLITDPTSRIPVTVGTKGERAIVSGTGDGLLQLLFVSPTHTIGRGDLVMTTENGGLLPSALAIGEVATVNGRTITVKPMRSVARADYVRIVQFRAPNADAVSLGAPRP